MEHWAVLEFPNIVTIEGSYNAVQFLLSVYIHRSETKRR